MSQNRAVLCDFFGTLTTAVTRGPWHRPLARRLGCDPAEFTAVLDRSFRSRAEGRFGTAEETLRWVCHQLGVDPSPSVLRAVLVDRVAAVRSDTRLRPDAVALLTTLRERGLATAVVSDCGPELPAFWSTLPVAPLVNTGVFSVEVGHCKPHPAMYLTACRRLGVAPQECLYVGDGGGQELSGAVALGMQALRLAAPDLGNHLVYAADRTFRGPAVTSLTDVLAYLDDHRPAAPVVTEESADRGRGATAEPGGKRPTAAERGARRGGRSGARHPAVPVVAGADTTVTSPL